MVKMKFKIYKVNVYEKTILNEYHFLYYKEFKDLENAINFAKEINMQGDKAKMEIVFELKGWEE